MLHSITRKQVAACVVAFVTSIAAQALGDVAAVAKLKPLFLTTAIAEGKESRASIVTPDRYRKVAEELARDIESATGARLQIRSDVDAVKDFGKNGNVIALGHYGTNKLIERLYLHWFVVVDGSQPGAGGMLLTTVHNPEGAGVNVVVVSGSDDDGVRKAAKRLAEVVKTNGATLPRLHEVVLGEGKDLVQARIKEVLDPARDWPVIHPMEALGAIAEAAVLYEYTGKDELAQAFKDRLLKWLDMPQHHLSASDDLYRVIIGWDLIEESSVFSDAERLDITNRLLALVRQETQEYPANSRVPNHNLRNFTTAKEKDRIRTNHVSRYANTLFFAGRYFDKYYRVPEARTWVQDARQYFRPQMKQHVVLDGATNIALISFTEMLLYALADDQQSFITPEVLGRVADRGLLRTQAGRDLPDWETPFNYWGAAAHLLNRPYYLKPVAALDPKMSKLRLPWRNRWELGRSYWDGVVPGEGDRPAQWVQSMPLTPQYLQQAELHGPVNVLPAKSFEFIAFTPPASKARQYLILQGHSTGGYSSDSANAIQEFWSHGRRLLIGVGRVATSQKLTSVTIVRDGTNEPLPAFASMEGASSNEQWASSRTLLRDANGADWYRNVVFVPDQWMLVIDDVRAKKPGDFVLESRWVTEHRTGFDGEDAVVLAPGETSEHPLTMRLSTVGWDRQYIVPWLFTDYIKSPPRLAPPKFADMRDPSPPGFVSILARRWSGELKLGESHVFATLASVTDQSARKPLKLLKKSDVEFVVAAADRSWTVTIGGDGKPSVSDGPTVADFATAARHEASNAAASAKPVWSIDEPARVMSSAAVKDKEKQLWAVGTMDGRIRLIDDRGTDAGTIKMPGQVLALFGTDLDGDGRDEIVAGSDVGGLRAFALDGKQLWEFTPPESKPNPSWRQSMGKQRSVITDILPLRDRNGGDKLLAAGLFFYVLDRQGKLCGTYDVEGEIPFTDLVGIKGQGVGRTTENTLILGTADIDGDGVQELAGDVNDPGYPRARAWSASGKRVAGYTRPQERYQGSAITHVVGGDFDGDGKEEVALGADAYLDQLAVFRTEEAPLFSKRVGGAIDALIANDLDDDGKLDIVCGTELGQVQAFHGDGTRILFADAGAGVRSIAVTPSGETSLWVGTIDGRVLTMSAKGQVTSDSYLGGDIDRIISSADGKRVLVTSVDGKIAAFATK